MAFVPIALQLAPLIPGLIQSIVTIVNSVRADPALPEEMKAQLDALSAALDEVAERVKGVELPPPGSGSAS